MEHQQKRSWSEVLTALQETHTLSIRDVCVMLKASRGWVNRYIRPHVDAVYLNSNIRGDAHVGRNWVKLAAAVLEREDMTESTWLHAGELMDLLHKSMVSCTKQTKRVPISALIEDTQKRKEYCATRAGIIQMAKELSRKTSPEAEKECAALFAKAETLHLEFVNEAAQELLKNTCGITARGKAERTDVEYPGDFSPATWVAPHDVKTYGDTDEDVYRRFFRNGAIRIELAVPDENGAVGSKVYYVEDPEPLTSEEEGDKIVIVSEAAWRKYKSLKEA